MRKFFYRSLWVGIVVLNIGLVLDSGSGFNNIVASMLSIWNADPMLGYTNSSYIENYVKSWSETKV